ncbi:MAG: hypothetical protein LBR78_01995 [Holosporales bacterium]|nr:hypothetical protein [Holosporales bacterium]
MMKWNVSQLITIIVATTADGQCAMLTTESGETYDTDTVPAPVTPPLTEVPQAVSFKQKRDAEELKNIGRLYGQLQRRLLEIDQNEVQMTDDKFAVAMRQARERPSEQAGAKIETIDRARKRWQQRYAEAHLRVRTMMDEVSEMPWDTQEERETLRMAMGKLGNLIDEYRQLIRTGAQELEPPREAIKHIPDVYHEYGGTLERERERIESLVVEITGDRDITGDEVGVGDEVDEIDIDGVVERGVGGSYVEDMQRQVGTLQALLCRYEEREERLRMIARIFPALPQGEEPNAASPEEEDA